MRFILSIFLLCSITAQAQIHGGFPWYRPTPKGNNFRLRNSNIIVSAGANQSVTNQTFTLSGGATNLSFPTHPLSYNWSLKSPFEFVQIVTATSSNTTVIVTNNNVSYVFELTAQDTPYFNSAFVTVNVSTPNPVTNQPPSITVISDQTVLENTATNVHWIWSDDATAVSAASYILSSSNTNLVPNANLVLDGTKTNLTITPLTHSNGVATISVTPIDSSLLPGITRQFAFNVLATNDPPTISNPGPQSTLQNTPKTVSFTIGDIETPPGNLNVSASSSDLSLALNSQLVLGGSGANRTVTITPVQNAFGTVNITIRASDGLIVTSAIFALTITHVNQPPTLGAIPDVGTAQATPVTLALNAADPDNNLTTASFSCTASSNPTLIGTGNVSFGGSAGAFTLTASPLAGQTGTSTITVQLTDGSLSVSRSFVLTVSTCTLNLGDRIVSWSPGVPGGIPLLSGSVSVATYGAFGNGVTDAYPAFTNALAHAGLSSYIDIPAGTYLLTKQIEVTRSGIVFRGAGSGSTKIVSTASSGSGIFYFHGTSSGTVSPAVSGYTKNSTSLVLSDASPYSVGNFIILEQTQDPAVLEGNIPSPTEFYQSQRNRVIGKSGNTLTLARPLYYTYNPAMNPHVKPWGPITNCGIENLYLQPSGGAISNLAANIYFFQTANCWVRGVESTNAYSFHVALDKTLACEVRSNYFHHSQAYGQGGYGADISLASDNLVEDNVFYYLRHAVIVQNGANGNVVAYNYGKRVFQQDWPYTDILQADIEMHGGHPYMNLVEGNVGVQYAMDSFWGSSRNNTFFRNWVQRYSDGEYNPITLGKQAIDIEKQQLYENVVGNILARPGDTGCIYNFGRDNNASCSDPITDTRVTNTMVFTANFDFVSSATQFDPTNCHNLPVSYFRTSKPSFFAATNNWPPIGPNVSTATSLTNFPLIPAQGRFVQPAEMVFPAISAKTVGMNGSITFPVTATDQAWPLLSLTGTSANTTIQPNSGIVVSGTPGSWSVTITPAANQFGTSLITMKAADRLHTNSQSFTLTVNQGNQPPTITSIANQSIPQNTSTAAIAFTVADPDTPVASLTNGKISSNTTLVPLSGIVFGGGTGANRTIQITPSANQTGSATITATVSDGTSTVGTSFVLNVTNAAFHTWFVRPPLHPAVYSGGNYVPMGTGTFPDPFDLFYAGDGAGGQIQPDDICWLLGDSHFGQYLDVFQPTVNGTSGHPIIFRNWNHEKVTINTLRGYPQVQGKKQGQDQSDSLAWNPKGNYIWLWGVEITSTNLVSTNRISTQTGGDTSNPTDLGFTGAIDVGAVPSDAGPIGIGSKFIHCYPNNQQQNGFWQLADDTETYGCLSQYPGWQGPDRGHGHNFYVQAEGSIGKRFLFNVAFSGNANGMQVFGKAATTFTQNITALGNVTLDNGELGSSGFASGFLLYTGGNAARNCGVFSNIFYYPHGTSPSADFGGPGESGTGVQNVVAAWNTITSRMKLNLGPGPFTFTNNTCYVNDFSTGAQGGLEGLSTATYPNNTYTTSRPPQTNIVFKTDAYEAKRGMIVCLWNTAGGAVTVTPSDLTRLGYASGDSVELCSASDCRPGHALFSGTWIGGNISIPLSSISLAPVIGGSTHPPSNPVSDITVLFVTNGYHAF